MIHVILGVLYQRSDTGNQQMGETQTTKVHTCAQFTCLPVCLSIFCLFSLPLCVCGFVCLVPAYRRAFFFPIICMYSSAFNMCVYYKKNETDFTCCACVCVCMGGGEGGEGWRGGAHVCMYACIHVSICVHTCVACAEYVL